MNTVYIATFRVFGPQVRAFAEKQSAIDWIESCVHAVFQPEAYQHRVLGSGTELWTSQSMVGGQYLGVEWFAEVEALRVAR